MTRVLIDGRIAEIGRAALAPEPGLPTGGARTTKELIEIANKLAVPPDSRPLSVLDFSRCHTCGIAHPIRLLGVVVLDRHGSEATAELYCVDCYPRPDWRRALPGWLRNLLRRYAGVVVSFSTWCPMFGDEGPTADEIAFIREHGAEIGGDA